MKKNQFLFLAMCIFIKNYSTIAQSPTKTNSQSSTSNTFINSNLTFKIINTPNNTYCYDVFYDGRLMIHQPSIPGLRGNEGFKNQQQATSIAKLVISKIKKGEMPPTVTIEEMKKLKAI